MKLKVLITGGTGLLGWQLLLGIPSHWEVAVALCRNQQLPLFNPRVRTVKLDVRDREQVKRVIEEVEPEIILHTASIGSVDYCENHREEAWQVNVEGTRHLLECSQPYDPVFVFTSTLYVFDGETPPYDEDARPHPTSHYSRTKLEGERLVLQLNRRPAVFRLATMYGWHSVNQRQNWVTWLISQLEKRKPVQVTTDLLNNYLWVGDACDAIRAALEKAAQGLIHLGGSRVADRYEFSLQIARIFGLDGGLLSPASSDNFPGLVARPRNASCTNRRLRDLLGIKPLNIEDGLSAMRDSVLVSSASAAKI